MNQKQNRWGTLLFVLGMCLVSFSAYAVPEGEFATWTGVRVDWQLNPKVKFRGTFQARTQNGLKEMERERLNVGLNYRVLRDGTGTVECGVELSCITAIAAERILRVTIP